MIAFKKWVTFTQLKEVVVNALKNPVRRKIDKDLSQKTNWLKRCKTN
jgi:hypothetical protein